MVVLEIHLFEGQTYREKGLGQNEQERDKNMPICWFTPYAATVRTSQPEARSFIWPFYMRSGTQGEGPSSTAFAAALEGCWIGGKAAGIQNSAYMQCQG